jgi:hypothetical protein
VSRIDLSEEIKELE